MSHCRSTGETNPERPAGTPLQTRTFPSVEGELLPERGLARTPNLSRRRFLASVGLSAAALVVGGARVFAQSPAKLKVGFLLPEKGTLAPEAHSLKAGFELYLREEPELAARAEMIFQDPGDDETQTLEALAKLVMSKEVQFLVGPLDTEKSVQVSHGVADRGVILFVTNPCVRFVAGELCFPASFRVRPNTYQSAQPLAPWALSNLGVRGFLTGNDDSIGNEMADFFAHGFERAGGTFTDRIMAGEEETDFENILKALAKLKPDFVFASYRGSMAVAFIQAIHRAKPPISCPIIGPESLTEFPSTLLALGTGASPVKTLSSLKDPVGLVGKIKSKLGKEVTHASRAAEGYDIGAVIGEAGKSVGKEKPDPAKMVQIIEGLKIEGAHGQLSFDKNHEPVLPVMVQQWESAKGSPKRKIVATLGECASKDFGCGKVGFPKRQRDEAVEENDGELLEKE